MASLLKCTTRTLIIVDYYDLEKLIEQVYGHAFSVPADLECNNDSDHKFKINGIVRKYEATRLEEFKKTGQGSYLTDTILNDLASRGIIDTGDYLINVSW